MSRAASRFQRWLGFALIAAIWVLLLGLLGFFGGAYAIYADLKSPESSRLAAGSGAEFIAGTLYQRVFMPQWQNSEYAQFDPELIYVPKPGTFRFSGPEFTTRITMTGDGLRAQPPPSDASGPMVVLAGDSYTMGWGVEDDQTFAAILQQRHGHRTVNTGVSSYGTARELLRLRRLGLLTPASVLVIQYCANDAPENHEFLRRNDGGVATKAPAEIWAEINRGRRLELTYPHVVRGTIGVLRELRAENSWTQLLRTLAGHSRVRARNYSRTFRHAAEDFLAVLDRFPELTGKRVIVMELNPYGDDSPFLTNLEKVAGERPRLRVLRLPLESADYFRFDAHLRPAGHARVAAELDRALREFATTDATTTVLR